LPTSGPLFEILREHQRQSQTGFCLAGRLLVEFGQADVAEQELTAAGDFGLQGDVAVQFFQPLDLPRLLAVDLQGCRNPADRQFKPVPIAHLDGNWIFPRRKTVQIALHALAQVDLVTFRPRPAGGHFVVTKIDAGVPVVVAERFPFIVQDKIAILLRRLHQSVAGLQ